MSTLEAFSSPQITDAPPPSARTHRPRGFRERIRTWLKICADYYDAAALYEQFAALSDAELARRGLSRATLARDVCAACDRGGEQQPG
jgi:hypothetical protein